MLFASSVSTIGPSPFLYQRKIIRHNQLIYKGFFKSVTWMSFDLIMICNGKLLYTGDIVAANGYTFSDFQLFS